MINTVELKPIDRHFAEFILSEMKERSEVLKSVISLLSSAVGNGNICLNLPDIAGRKFRMDGYDLRLPDVSDLQNHLSTFPVVGSPGDFRPLILDGNGRFYLYRYWKYEKDLAGILLKKAAIRHGISDPSLLKQGLDRLFPNPAPQDIDWQKAAAFAACLKNVCIISGGPGTGKTSTVVKILVLLMEQAGDRNLKIALAAPTGKAAARLKESIVRMKTDLVCDNSLRERIPEDVSTLHRLLGAVPGSVRFRHSEANPLPHDVVIIDEASMVPLPLMAKLTSALKPEARFIVLGDRDQLASVEAGAVLGDICGGGHPEVFSNSFCSLYAELSGESISPSADEAPFPPLADSLIVLKKNYRFSLESGIGALANAVNSGNPEAAASILKNSPSAIAWNDAPKPEALKKRITDAVIDGYGPYLFAETAEQALKDFDTFRILCALRLGPYGVEAVNAMIERILAENGRIDPNQKWYKGRPVMITANDYHLKLFNGDIGIAFPHPDGDGSPRVFFPAPGGGVRHFSPLRLPAHETVFAMTIHKSQGSEFDRVHLFLPPDDAPILTRELIYTGITRAKQKVDIWGAVEIFTGAVTRKIDRKSGLGEALWPDRKELRDGS